MMKPISEYSFKSLENSSNINDKDWVIISIKVTKLITDVDLGCKYCLYRKIAYLEKNDTTYQTGSMFIPINNFKNILFFIKLLYSRKTLGHYISVNYSNKYRIKLLSIDEINNSNNLLLNNSSKIKVSRRVIFIPIKKIKLYVEEELDIS